jgi:WD40 repeat protein
LIVLCIIRAAGAADADSPLLKYVGTLRGTGGTLVLFSPDGSKLLTVGGNVARIWDVKTLKAATAPLEHEAPIDDAGWTAAEDRIFTAGGTEVRFWDMAGRELMRLSQKAPVKPTCVSPDGVLIVTGDEAGAGTVWEAASRTQIRKLTGPGLLRSAAFSSDGTKLLTVTWPEPKRDHKHNVVRVMDRKAGQELLKPIDSELLPENSCAAEFSPDGNRVIVADSPIGKSFSVFDVRKR